MSVLLDYARAGVYLCLRNGNLWANGRLLPEEVGALTEQRAELVRQIQTEARAPSREFMAFRLECAQMLNIGYTHTDDVKTKVFVDCLKQLHHFIEQQNQAETLRECVRIVRVFSPVEDVWRKI
jgi:hypothetical protein